VGGEEAGEEAWVEMGSSSKETRRTTRGSHGDDGGILSLSLVLALGMVALLLSVG